MKTALCIILAIILIWVAIELFLRYLARAESDVNGDPERDAGLIPERSNEPPWWAIGVVFSIAVSVCIRFLHSLHQ